MTAAVEVTDVARRFGSVQALCGVDLVVAPGEFFGLLGPNGAGKTTLISIIAGLTRADRGRARILGHDVVFDFREARRSLGVVPQELVFDPFFSVRETLEFQAGYFGLRRQDAWIDEILHHLDLTGKANANMRSLSGGMKRRVLVGQALVHKPPVIVLDEPTAGVDVELRQNLWAFIRKLNRDGHTIILTTHYLEEAEALCGRIAMLKAGRIVALDSTQNLLSRFAGITCRLAVSRVPASWQARVVRQEGHLYYIGLTSYAELEELLASLRTEGIAIDELALEETDLEQVFLRIMKNRGIRTKAMNEVAGRGWVALLHKELLRFWKVSFQTIAAPILTSLLYLLIFSHVLEGRVSVYEGRVSYTAFLVPGLVMMSVLQNSFANSSSSLIQSKITGNLIFVLLPPLSAADLFAAYVLGAMVRGLVVGLGVFLVTLVFAPALLAMPHPLWALAFALLRQRHPRHARAPRRDVGRQVRPARRVPELHHRAADVPVGRVLLDPLAAAVLAGTVARQSVLLYDRWLPLRLFRRFGRGAGFEPRRRRGRRAGTLRADAHACFTAAGSCALTSDRIRRWSLPNPCRSPSRSGLALRARRGPRRRPALRGAHRLARVRRPVQDQAAPARLRARWATACARKSTRCRCRRSPRSSGRERRDG